MLDYLQGLIDLYNHNFRILLKSQTHGSHLHLQQSRIHLENSMDASTTKLHYAMLINKIGYAVCS